MTITEPEVFPPTLREVMLRGRWIGMLALCLVVAGIFAWLGQWQLSRAIDVNPREEGATEQVLPIAEVVQPGEYLPEPLVGQRVALAGTWMPDDFLVVSSRYNDGEEGYWVTGQLRLTEATTGLVNQPVSIAAAVGWAATPEEAEDAASALSAHAAENPNAVSEFTGRIISDEGQLLPPADDPQIMERMSPAVLLGRWHDVADLDVYRPYFTLDVPLGDLTDISSPAPDQGSSVNWLNIFYAAEWVVFAGFAFYLWYRLAKDAWEKELEDLEEAQSA